MELILIRHGSGEHTLKYPSQLNLLHPSLTNEGKEQAKQLREELKPNEQSIFITSPTMRTIETALILSEGISKKKIFVSTYLGPRMFPHNQEMKPYRCDEILQIQEIEEKFNQLHIIQSSEHPTWLNGINTIPKDQFNQYASEMLNWCRAQECTCYYLVTHDGTITNYREYFGEVN